VLALPAESLLFDPTYPEPPDRSGNRRNEQFAIVEVLWSAGRSVKVKKQLLQHLVAGLQHIGFDPEQLMLVFKETTWENWAFAGGRLLHA